jgi:hypothetical protein
MMKKDIDWLLLSNDEIQKIASNYEHDHNDGSECFFEASKAEWSYRLIDPFTLNIFKDIDSAKEWFNDEIYALVTDKNVSRAMYYKKMLSDGFSEPITIGQFEDSIGLWDGYHRLAISIIRKEFIPAIIGIYI